LIILARECNYYGSVLARERGYYARVVVPQRRRDRSREQA